MKKLSILGLLVVSALAYPSCGMCHNGMFQDSLSNLTPKEIITKMHEFKKSNGTRMSSIAKEMTDKEIEEVAKEYGKQ